MLIPNFPICLSKRHVFFSNGPTLVKVMLDATETVPEKYKGLNKINVYFQFSKV